ncbi:MAG: type II toxin-antitoxin system HicA family toxin [Candidatus Electrothrix sp. Rat3]|nr:type II toxin-antitoxin system HicA family toxin [Candidatus Electrothrix rattekaaiensis]
MNSKHRKTLTAIFSSPVPGSLEWRRIETLFVALDAQVIEGNGSRVSFIINGEKGDFHRPHPGKEAKRYQVRNARDFLARAGVKI